MQIMLIIIYCARYFYRVNIRSCGTIISIIRDCTSLLAEVSHNTSATPAHLQIKTTKEGAINVSH